MFQREFDAKGVDRALFVMTRQAERLLPGVCPWVIPRELRVTEVRIADAVKHCVRTAVRLVGTGGGMCVRLNGEVLSVPDRQRGDPGVTPPIGCHVRVRMSKVELFAAGWHAAGQAAQRAVADPLLEEGLVQLVPVILRVIVQAIDPQLIDISPHRRL